MSERDKKRVLCFVGAFRYTGYLIAEDELTYTIEDQKDGIMRLPKAATVLKMLDEGVSQ